MDDVSFNEPQPLDLTAQFLAELQDGEHLIHDADLSLYVIANGGKVIAWRIVDRQGQELQYQVLFRVPPSMCEVCDA